VKLTRKIGLVMGPVIGAAGIGVLALAAGGGAALAASGPGTVCTGAISASCTFGSPVLSSVTVPSSTSLTVGSTSMSFGNVLPGNTGTGSVTYTLSDNDGNGVNVDAAWDDSMITGNTVGSIITVPANTGGGPSTGFQTGELLKTSDTHYDQGLTDLTSLACTSSGTSGSCTQGADIPWSDVSVAAGDLGGFTGAFAYNATGGLDPTQAEVGGSNTDNNTTSLGAGGGAGLQQEGSFGPVSSKNETDTYTLTVPGAQAAGVYAADLWYIAVSQ
jgi:hypothetical protein